MPPMLNPPPLPQTTLVSAFLPIYNDTVVSLLSYAYGPTDPPDTWPFMIWADTNEMKLKQRNSTDTAWSLLARLDEDWGGLLPKLGGTMEGPIDMGGFGITNLPLGSGTAPARYVDLSVYAKLDGSFPFTGIPSGPALDPSSDNQLARKKYVDTKVLAGGVFVGQIDMTVAPTIATHLMRKSDVDAAITGNTHVGGALGPRLEGSQALKAVSVGAGNYLRSTGVSQGVAWTPSPAGSARQVPLDILSNQTSSVAWTTEDLSLELLNADVSAVIRGAILLVWAEVSATTRWRVEFRRSSAVAAQVIEPTTEGIWYMTTTVPISSSKTFDWQVTKIGGGTVPVNIQYLGYM